MKKIQALLGATLIATGALACGGASQESATAQTTAAAPAAGQDQVALGAKLYGENCAGCHGANGEGNAKAPPVVGKDALPLEPRPQAQARKAPFHTAADVLDFVKKNMPPKNPGSLTDEQYAAIIAFDLHANGVNVSGKKVDATTASTYVLHP